MVKGLVDNFPLLPYSPSLAAREREGDYGRESGPAYG